MIVIAILALPLLAAALCWIPFTGKRAAAPVTFAASLALLVLTVELAARIIAVQKVVAAPNWIEVDSFGALILVLVAAVGFLACLYSLGYMPRTTHDSSILHHYYGNLNLFIFSMVAVPVVVSPSLEWLAVESTTLLSVLLVGFENNAEALEAAWKYAILTLTGAAIALFGFLLLFWAMEKGGGATYTWTGLAAVASKMPPVVLKTVYLMILVGFGAKVGLVPLHTWLPDAHSQAPTPICALLSGVETTAVLYVILRLIPIMHPALGGVVETWSLIFGLLSVGVAAFLLIQVHDYKRLFAYSTVEHMGIILTAAGIGGAAAHYGAMYEILAHAATKSFCFFAAGAVLLVMGKRDIAAVEGLMRRSLIAGSALLVGALAIAGAPPFVVFLGEFSILRAGISEGRYLVVALLALFLVVAFFGILLHVNRMVFGHPAGPVDERPGGLAYRPGSTASEQRNDSVDGPLPQPIHLERLEERRLIPLSCRLTLLLAVIPVVLLGVYVPHPVYELLSRAAALIGG
jgi:hydrogenase-4 component F